MKKIISLILILVLAVSVLIPTNAFASGISVTINGNYVKFDQPPVMENDRVLVPVRAIFEAMGCAVLWNDATQIVNVATEFGMMTLGIGSNYISYRNETEDKSIWCDVPPKIINGRTLVPVRAIAECTGYNVDWDDATQTVIITGEKFGLTIPDVDIPGYYEGTKTPDFSACFGIPLANHATPTEYTYKGVEPQELVDYIEKYLAGSGFLIDDEQEIFGLFGFFLSNPKTAECVRIIYTKADKELIIALSNG